MLYAIIGIACFAVGFIFAAACVSWLYLSGTFVINETNPDKDVYRLEFNKLSDVHKMHYILLKVKRES